MPRAFFISLIGHFSLLFFILFFDIPKNPQKFQVKVFFESPASTVKKKIPVTKKKQTNQKVAPRKTNLPQIITNSPLKLENLNLEIPLLSKLNTDEPQPQILKEKPVLEKISNQKPTIDLQQVNPQIEQQDIDIIPSIVSNQTTPQVINSEVDKEFWRGYKNRLAAIIRSNWDNAIQDTQVQTLVKITIQKNGGLIAYDILKKSGIFSFDLSVERALEISAPFPPFFAEYEEQDKVFHLQFQGGGSLISQ